MSTLVKAQSDPLYIRFYLTAILLIMAANYMITHCDSARGVIPQPSSAGRLASELHRQLMEGGGVSVPVFHRRTGVNGDYKQRHNKTVQGRIVLENSTSMSSSVITLGMPMGAYFATFQMGTPSVDLALIIDTGSELMWIQCDPCIACGPQENGYPIFNPKGSSSFNYLPCGNNGYCPTDNGVLGQCDTPNNICAYFVAYMDLSNTTGYLAQDSLLISSTEGSSLIKTKFTYGCGFKNQGTIASMGASGLLGLDQGNLSIVHQLGVTKFSYCLPYRDNNSSNASGYLTFGNASNKSISITYTPLIIRHNLYYVNMIGISVSGQLLQIPDNVFTLNASGGGGTILDSGTTLTYLVDTAYSTFHDAFNNAINPSLKRFDSGDGTSCYQTPANTRPSTPKVTLHFSNSLDLELDFGHLLYYYGTDSNSDYYCIAFLNAGTISSGGINIIGNLQQQNFHVEYDIENSRVGFAPIECNNSTISSQYNAPSTSYKDSSGSSSTNATQSLSDTTSLFTLKGKYIAYNLLFMSFMFGFL